MISAPTTTTAIPVSPLRQRMLDEMALRAFNEKTRHDYIRHVTTLTQFIGCAPDYGNGRRPSRLPGPHAREWRAATEHEQRGVSAAVFFHICLQCA